MESKIIILHASKPWEMTDEKTGEKRTGVSLQYMMTTDLAPRFDSVTGESGCVVTKQSISVEAAKALVDVPGIYNADMVLRAKSGKNVLEVSTVVFLTPLVNKRQ